LNWADSKALLKDYLIALDELIYRDEQHIIQKTIARNKYPEPENPLEFDLVLTSLS
jgi:hypothetical protein